MTRVLVLTPDVLKQRMAGPAIRAWEIASELSNSHDVRLVSVTGVPVERTSDRFTTAAIFKDRELRAQVSWAEVVVVQGTLTTEFPWIMKSKAKLVADIYDPMHLELLEQAIDFPITDRDRIVAAANASIDVQIQRADFMVCASEKQRDFWLGQLMANGRINPYTYADSGSLDHLLGIVPFGLPDEAPQSKKLSIRGVVPGIERDDEVIIWGGGIYNWFDPVTLVRAMREVITSRPRAKLFFMGSGHPNPDVPQMTVAREAREVAEQLGLLDSVVFFNEGWVPYEERASYLLDAAIGVSTHAVHLETEFSFRTRILDYLWCGLPMVVTEGDGFAALIERKRLGVVVPEGDESALARGIVRLLSDVSLYAETQQNVRAASTEFAWPRVLEPLVAFCNEPRFAPDRTVRGRKRFVRLPLTRQVVIGLRHGIAAKPLKLTRRIRLKLRRMLRSS